MEYERNQDTGVSRHNAMTSDYEISTIAFVAIAGLFVVLFITCVGLSIFLCLQMRGHHEDNPGTERSEHKNKKKRAKLREMLLKQFKDSVNRMSSKRNAVRPSSRGNINKDTPCAICLDPYVGNPVKVEVGLLKNCGHFYHFECIWQWMSRQANCPVCRKSVRLSENDITSVSFAEILSDKSLTEVIYQGDPGEAVPEVQVVSMVELGNNSTGSARSNTNRSSPTRLSNSAHTETSFYPTPTNPRPPDPSHPVQARNAVTSSHY